MLNTSRCTRAPTFRSCPSPRTCGPPCLPSSQSVRALAAAPHGPRSHVSVLQFSNDVRVEQVRMHSFHRLHLRHGS